MRVIGYGSNFEIYGNDLQTYDKLPAGTYAVKFNPMSGFSLKKVDDFKQLEEKVYGNHAEKIDKVIEAFNRMNRSLGVIMSGDKGIGKSMFTQILAEKAVTIDMPVIIVDKAYKGIASFLESIDQEVLVLFDEFEKVFDSRKDGIESQDDLLGLFDGMSQKKRIYAITVNDLNRVNEFMINRPGRFHYHFRFDYPAGEEIKTYLQDKVPTEFHGEISAVTNFARRIKLNYDCLRAIAFELSMGIAFSDAIRDLNILNISPQRYDIEIVYENAASAKIFRQQLELFEESTSTYGYVESDEISVTFSPRDLTDINGVLVCPADKATIYYDDDNKKFTNKLNVKHIIITQVGTKDMHYNYKAF